MHNCVQGEEGTEESQERKLGDCFIQLLASLNLCDVPEEPRIRCLDAWGEGSVGGPIRGCEPFRISSFLCTFVALE